MAHEGKLHDMPDLFPGFTQHDIEARGLTFHVRCGGNGPPLLCLHGYPQTHVCWHRIASELAQHYTVIVMDLRGYGQSSAPGTEADDNHETYAKRTMGDDAVAVMQALGHEAFAVMGHDRGGRVAYRLALDHAGRITHAVMVDIIPTLDNWSRMRATSALSSYHWAFLAQPHPLPERLIASAPDYYLEHTLASWTKCKTLAPFDADALTHYRASISTPARIHAMCEDYRAGATFDWEADKATRDNKETIDVPVHVLWSTSYLTATKGSFDPLEVWRPWAPRVSGTEIDAGHFLAEENPDATRSAVLNFLQSSNQ